MELAPAFLDSLLKAQEHYGASGEVEHSELINYMNCSWAIRCTDRAAVVSLAFRRFDLEAGWDYLYLYDGQDANGLPSQTLHGSALPVE